MPNGRDVELRVDPRRTLLTLMGVNTLLVMLSLAVLGGFKFLGTPGWLLWLYGVANIDAERTLPAVYSSLQLLAAAALIGLVAVAQGSIARGAPRRFCALAMLFVLLAADEAFAFHEAMGRAMHRQLQLEGPLRGCWTWVLAGTPIVLVTGACFLPLLWKLHTSTRRWIVLAAALFIGGALGLEAVGGMVQTLRGGLAYHMVVAVEEWCEMTGISVLLFALMRELSQRPSIRLAVAAPASPRHTESLFASLPA